MNISKKFLSYALAFILTFGLVPGSLMSVSAAGLDDIILTATNYSEETLEIPEGITVSDAEGEEIDVSEDGVLDLSDLWGSTITFEDEEENSKILKLPARPNTPTAKINFTSCTITGVSKLMVYRTDEEDDFEEFTGTTFPIEPSASEIVFEIKLKASVNKPASGIQTLTVPAVPATPVAGIVSVDFAKDILVINGEGYEASYVGSNGKQGAWSAVTSKGYALSSARNAGATEILIRIKATATSFASGIYKHEFDKASAGAPAAELDIVNEKLTKVSDAMEYSINGGSWTKITAGATTVDLSSKISTADITAAVRTKATSDEPASKSVIFNIAQRPATPTATSIGFNFTTEEFAELKAASGLVYSIDSGVSWKVPDAATLTLSDLGTAKTLLVKVPAKAEPVEDKYIPASKTYSFTAPVRGAAPSISIDLKAGAVKGFTATKPAEYQILDTASTTPLANGWKDVELDGALLPFSKIVGGSEKYLVARIKVTDKAIVSSVSNALKLPEMSDAFDKPTTIVFKKATESITGVDSSMEYKLSTASAYTAITGTELSVSALLDKATDDNTSVSIRIKTVSTAENYTPASEPVDIIIGKRPAKPLDNAVKISFATEKMTLTNAQYSTDKTKWADVEDNTISGLIPVSGKAKTIYLRVKASDAAVASEYATVTLDVRPATPKLTVDYAAETITGLNDLVVKLPGDNNFETIDDGVLDLSTYGLGTEQVSIAVKKASTENSFASAEAIFVVSRAAAPNVSYDKIKDIFTGAKTTMEYKIDDGEWIAVPSSTFSPTEAMISKGVSFRTAATTKALPSKSTAAIEVPKNTTPANKVAFDYETELLTPEAEGSEYSVDGGIKWIKFSKTKAASITKDLDAATDDLNVLYRNAATKTEPASKTGSIPITKRAAAPDGSIDPKTMLLKDLPDDVDLEYSIDKGSTWKAADEETPLPVSTKAFEVWLRVVASEEILSSKINIMPVAAPPKAPVVSKGVIVNYSALKITDLPADLEYSYDDKSFTAVEGTSISIDKDKYNPLNATKAVDIFVRVPGTTTTPPSPSSKITLAVQGKAPAPTYSAADVKLSKATNMEYYLSEDSEADLDAMAVSDKWVVIEAGEVVFDSEANGLYLFVRTCVSEKAPASAIKALGKIVSINTVAPDDEKVYFDADKNLIVGVDSKMEYSLNGIYWTAASKAIDVSWLRTGNAVSVYIRYKKTAKVPASTHITVSVAAFPEIEG